MKNIFVTGIDTDIGKTFVSIGLCLKAQNENKKVGYFKPFQSGAKINDDGTIIAPDLFELKKYSSIPSMYSYLFNGEVSPHLASLLNNIEVDMNKVTNDYINFSKQFDLTVIEGAGGFYCPAVKGKLFSDIIKILNQANPLETIIVTTPTLGKLNHTLMTLELAKVNDIKIKGLIINSMPKNPTLSEKNFIKELGCFSDVEILGIIPKLENCNKNTIIEAFKDINL